MTDPPPSVFRGAAGYLYTQKGTETMAQLLKGAPVAAALNEKTSSLAEALRAKGVPPVLAIVRVGARTDDLSYERGAMKRAKELGISVRHAVFPATVDNGTFCRYLDALGADPTVHGILLFRPLPKTLDEAEAIRHIVPAKDVDGCTAGSLAGVFLNEPLGFAPCTAQAAMEILAHYGIDLSGKRAVVIGRSPVVGRPAAMLLMHRNATVTICHTRTKDVPSLTREADIVIACSGQIDTLGAEYFAPGQTVIDVGIGWSDRLNKLCGDVRFDEVEPSVGAITPVPGGVGSVTTAVLMHHVVLAAEKAAVLEA